MTLTVSGTQQGNTDVVCEGAWFHPAPSAKGEFHQLRCGDGSVRVDLWQTEQRQGSGGQPVLEMNVGVAVE